MHAERLCLVGEALAGGPAGDRMAALERLLAVSLEMLGVTRASVAVIGDGQHQGSLASPDPAPARSTTCSSAWVRGRA